mmetsp:Transcript_37921/g.80589  ORF Transcript_37921/g.80589 Transcript_37921/m.80589 type:complete len:312 (+) Transcript_37921:105-1040(+)
MSGPREVGGNAVAPSVSLQVTGSGVAEASSTKTIIIPRSLPELQQIASRQFNYDGRMRFYCKGKEMHHPLAVSTLQDGDVITVRLDSSRAIASAGEKMLSTHQADFVRHPPGPPVEYKGNDSASTLTSDTRQCRLEGQSRYASDYIKHPRTPRQIPVDPALFHSHFLSHAGEAEQKSTYLSHFPWHNAQAANSAGSDELSTLSEAGRGHPFQGRSSYADDFITRVGERQKPVQASGSDHASTLTDMTAKSKFEGLSSYNADFIKHNLNCRMPSARPIHSDSASGTFEGASEYRCQYYEYDPRAPRVHLQMT